MRFPRIRRNIMKWSQRIFGFSAVLVVAVLLAMGCSKTPAEPGTGPSLIRLGRVSAGDGYGPLDAAIKFGDFEKAGIKLELANFSNGTDGVAALVGGSLDLFQGSYEHVLRQIENGLDFKSFALLNNRKGYKVLVKTNSPYQRLEDLKGKTLGVTKVGSLSDTTLRKILRERGIDPETGVNIISVGNGATVVAALDSGNAAAAMVGSVTQLIESGEYRILYDPDFETAGLVYFGSSKWAKENTGALRSFLKIYQERLIERHDYPERYVDYFIEDRPNITRETFLKEILDDIPNHPLDMITTKAAADDVVETQLAQGTITRAITMEEAVDNSYLP
jgi:ABC-type nitrate/sulfonate/bicarbonate transport system substrate-binding protein